MWSSRLFWKLFLSYTAVFLIAAVALLYVITKGQEEQINEQVDLRLRHAAVFLQTDFAAMIEEAPSQSLQQRIMQLGRQTQTRITLMTVDGRVVADSARDGLDVVNLMENHLSRPEMQKALNSKSGFGTSERRSATLDQALRYFAMRYPIEGEPLGVIRTSVAVDAIREEVAERNRLVLGLLLAVSISISVFTYWLVARILRPIGQLTQAAEVMATGTYDQKLHVASRDELGKLAAAFNHMTHELSQRIQDLLHSN